MDSSIIKEKGEVIPGAFIIVKIDVTFNIQYIINKLWSTYISLNEEHVCLFSISIIILNYIIVPMPT